MATTLLTGPPDALLSEALQRFERQFSYPLGSDRRFCIDHRGDDRRFFQALGEAVLAVQTEGGTVAGLVGAALRTLVAPGGQERQVLYVGDLKISLEARGGRTLLRLIRLIQDWATPRAQAAYAIVMDGTAATPADYTGRLGVPAFRAVAQSTLLWLRTDRPLPHVPDAVAVGAIEPDAGRALLSSLAAGHHHAVGVDSALRSALAPRWVCTPDGRGCAVLEDTRTAKRLVDLGGAEMRSAHLTCCARDALTARELIGHGLSIAGELGYEMLFVAVAGSDVPLHQATFAQQLLALAPLTVYAAGEWAPGPWLISSADI